MLLCLGANDDEMDDRRIQDPLRVQRHRECPET
jgi:hypothetical protein